MSISKEHYLKHELYQLIGNDPTVFDFLQVGSFDGLWYWDIEKPENEWMNPVFWELLGYEPSKKKHLASEWQDLINPDDLRVVLHNFQKHCEDPNHPYDQIVRYRHKDGSTVWVRCRGIAIRDPSGKPIRMLGVHNDLTQIKRTEEMLRDKNKELEKIARYDHLTSLYNRLAFDEHFEKQLLISIRESIPVSLTIIDIDHFKHINDDFGHLKGDEVLRSVADLLRDTARDSDTLARFGGDEFIVLLFGINRPDSIQVGERFRLAVDSQVKGHENVTVSVGISTYYNESQADQDINATEICAEIISQADKALYMAKRNGRNQVRHYKYITRSDKGISRDCNDQNAHQ